MLMCSCGQEEGEPTSPNYECISIGPSYKVCYYTTEIDSCEYLVTSNSPGIGLAHKGNCKYCKMRKDETNN